jgi:hypothetical protein
MSAAGIAEVATGPPGRAASRRPLESMYPRSVPLEVDIGIADHWADA